MSELIQENDDRATIRWKLLTGVSALALTAYVSSASVAKAEDADRPPVWIELGGQMEAMQGVDSPFSAHFMTAITPTPGPYSDDIFTQGQKPARFAFDEEGKISFQPENSDWVFSADFRYGRSNSNKHIHHQSPDLTFYNFGVTFDYFAAPFADIKSHYKEAHAIIDFSAGKDVGLGAFGRDGTSEIDLGVRFAQLATNSSVNIYARPSIGLSLHHLYGRAEITFYAYTMAAQAQRSFRGVGPSLSWNASAALAGNKQDGELTLDWGINGAILFGRQKSKTRHSTQAYHQGTAYYPSYRGYYYSKVYQKGPHPHTRSRRVVVPNIGGFAGLSVKYPNVKFSVGYRYDTFLNAMDTGIDAAKKSNLTFNGPYASISIGLGD